MKNRCVPAQGLMSAVLVVLAMVPMVFSGPAEATVKHPLPSRGAFAIERFYDELAPYGAWTQHPGHGHVWLPRTVAPDWRPYTVGNWVLTEEHGWFWDSQEPFAWAVYHYGRWGFDSRLGWFWVPGDTWGPAWVSWRYGDEYVGWAPEEPVPSGRYVYGVPAQHRPPARRDAWVFVEPRHLTAPAVRSYAVPAKSLSIVFNVTRYGAQPRYRNGAIYNYGMPRDRWTRITRQTIQPRRIYRGSKRTRPKDWNRQRPGSLYVFAPAVRKGVGPSRPPKNVIHKRAVAKATVKVSRKSSGGKQARHVVRNSKDKRHGHPNKKRQDAKSNDAKGHARGRTAKSGAARSKVAAPKSTKAASAKRVTAKAGKPPSPKTKDSKAKNPKSKNPMAKTPKSKNPKVKGPKAKKPKAKNSEPQIAKEASATTKGQRVTMSRSKDSKTKGPERPKQVTRRAGRTSPGAAKPGSPKSSKVKTAKVTSAKSKTTSARSTAKQAKPKQVAAKMAASKPPQVKAPRRAAGRAKPPKTPTYSRASQNSKSRKAKVRSSGRKPTAVSGTGPARTKTVMAKSRPSSSKGKNTTARQSGRGGKTATHRAKKDPKKHKIRRPS